MNQYNYTGRDEAAIKASHQRSNLQRGLLGLHFSFFCGISCTAWTVIDGAFDPGIWLIILMFHFFIAFRVLNYENRLRRAAGARRIVVPVPSVYTDNPQKPKRKNNYVRADDGTLFEVIEDEDAPILPDVKPKRKRD